MAGYGVITLLQVTTSRGSHSGTAMTAGISGYEQAEAEFCRVEADEVMVALGPPA